MSEPNNTPKSLQTLLAKNGLKSGKLSATSGTPTGNGGALDHETKLLVNMIFARFHHIYTHKFESAYGDESTLTLAKREWAYSLAGTPAHLVEYALERCKLEFAWPPTIADFVQLLQPQPEALGLPGIREAYLEACQNSHSPANRHWSHAAVHLAARDVGFFRMRTEAERYSWPPFEKAYQERVNQVARGEELVVSEPAIALPDPLFSEDRFSFTEVPDKPDALHALIKWRIAREHRLNADDIAASHQRLPGEGDASYLVRFTAKATIDAVEDAARRAGLTPTLIEAQSRFQVPSDLAAEATAQVVVSDHWWSLIYRDAATPECHVRSDWRSGDIATLTSALTRLIRTMSRAEANLAVALSAAMASSTSPGAKRVRDSLPKAQPCTMASAVPSASGRPKLDMAQAGGSISPSTRPLIQIASTAAKP